MIQNLHICTLGPFIPPFFSFIRKEFSHTSNTFYMFGDLIKYSIKLDKNVILHKNGKLGYLKLLPKLYSADKIIIHGLFDVYLIILLVLNPWLLKKCYWVMWGADLYSFMYPQNNFKYKISEFLKSIVIRKMGYLLTYIKGDVEVARKQYCAQGKYLENIAYLSNIFNYRMGNKKNNDTTNILIGNSADPTNEHLEVFKKIEFVKDCDIKIFTPLSYGNQEYAMQVVKKGDDVFGDKFKGLLDFILYEEYLDLLDSIDIAIFNHKRQQAMGNTINLIGMGKIVYLRKDTTQWNFFNELSIDVLDINDFELKKTVNSKENSQKIVQYFSYENLLKQWTGVLEG